MLSTSPELARQALDAAPDAMIIIDADGTVRYANRQASVIFGYEHQEIVGHSVEQLMPPRFWSRHLLHRQQYQKALRVRAMGEGLQLFGQRRDGSEFPVEISLSPLPDGNQMLVAAAIRDVTDRKRVELELIAARQDAERAREFADEARQTADRANQSKSRFLATASHDLRQPLQTLSLLNGALRRTSNDPETSEVLAQQEQAINTMAKLLNTLLDISKLESGAIKPQITDFKVALIFQELRTEFLQLARQKGLELKLELCDDRVHSDPSLINQLMRNLVSNAIKYTREGSVLLRCLHEPPQVRLEVIDTGIGIPASDMAHIFEEFYQVGVPANVSREGYGLGLSIVRRIAQLLDATLDVQSQPGKGSSFSVALPAAPEAQKAAEIELIDRAESMHSRPSQTVLLIEDDAAVRNATRMLLKVAGYRVLVAESKQAALEQAKGHPELTLLIADYHLAADETGMQAITAVRELLGKPLKAVLMTGDTSSAVQEAAQDRRLRIASKPINASELLALLEGLVAA